MKDSEIIWAFSHTLGEGILGRDDVDHRDQAEILKILESAAKSLMPFAHKYSADSNCKSCAECKNYKKNSYNEEDCRFSSYYGDKCYKTVERPFFERKKGVRKG